MPKHELVKLLWVIIMVWDGSDRRKMACADAPCLFQGKTEEQINYEIRKFAKEGAKALLEELGFVTDEGKIDKEAAADFSALRQMLKDWRDFKQDTRRIILKWVLFIMLGFTTIKLGWAEYLRMGKQ